MKKHLFTALLAIFAVGSVFAMNANKAAFTEYYDVNGNPVNCAAGTISCVGLTLYDSPDPDTRVLIPQSALIGTFHN